MTRGGARLDAGRPAALCQHALGLGLDEHARAGVVRVLDPGLERRLLGAELAAVVTQAADLRGAAAHVALHHLPVPAELVEASADGLVAGAREAVLGVHADALPDRVEAAVEVLAGDRVDAVLYGPLAPDVLGRAEAERVVDERRAAKTLGCEQADAPVGGRHAAAVDVEAVEAGQLGAVEVALAEVTARLDDHDVEPLLREHGGSRAAARARADHDDVAVERRVLGHGKRLDRSRRRVGRRPERTGIADRVPDRIAVSVAAVHAVVGEQHALAQGLEGGAPLDQAAVGPGEQDRLPLGLRERAEAPRAGPGDRPEQARVPDAEQLRDLAALGRARVAPDQAQQRLGNADLGRRRQAVAAGDEGVADAVEGGAGFGGQRGGGHCPNARAPAASCQARRARRMARSSAARAAAPRVRSSHGIRATCMPSAASRRSRRRSSWNARRVR